VWEKAKLQLGVLGLEQKETRQKSLLLELLLASWLRPF
jgi:hypothetical protein